MIFLTQRFKVALFLLPIGILFSSSGAFSGPQNVEALFQSAKRQYAALFNSPKKLADRAEWETVVSKFRLVIRTSPASSRAGESLYTVGLIYKNLYRRTGSAADRREALASFNGFVDRYPKSRLIPDAKRHIGDIQFMAKDYANASRTYKSAGRKPAAKSQMKTVSLAPSSKTPQAAPLPRQQSPENGETTWLEKIRQYSADGHTRVVFDISGQTAYNVEPLDNNRIAIDLMDVKPAEAVSRVIEFDKGLARRLSLEGGANGVTRVVIELAGGGVDSAVMALKNPFRVVMDLSGSRKPEPSPEKPAAAESSKPSATENAESIMFAPDPGRIRTIVLDPGHGGKDPGAIGPTGLMEKDIALDIAKRLKPILESRMKCKVLLTRTTDRFLELDERTMFANSVNADLFVSIHLNASRDRRARGVETYFLSPARSKDELETAARENMMALGSQDDIENDLAYIMSDMSNTQKINDSSSLAGTIQNNMTSGLRRADIPVKDKGVKQAMFYVLWRASMPSALIEAGFISNREEERRFKSAAYREKIAESIAAGLSSYGREYMVASAE